MLISGVIGSEGRMRTAGLINSLLAPKGLKVSIIDLSNLISLDGQKIREYVRELDKNGTDVLLMRMGIEDAYKFLKDDVRFDIVICTDKEKETVESGKRPYSEKMARVLSHMADNGIAIVNVDDGELISLLKGKKHNYVTYGFNKKASITTSSIGDTVSEEGFICCLQRTISIRNGTVIEPQEFKLRIDEKETDGRNILAAASFALVNGIDLGNIGGIQTTK